jgi:hypothetical protein
VVAELLVTQTAEQEELVATAIVSS